MPFCGLFCSDYFMQIGEYMNNFLRKIGFSSLIFFSLAAGAAEGGLSREMSPSEFLVTVPGKIDSYDRASVVDAAFGELTDRLTAGQFSGTVSIDRDSLEQYVESVDSTDGGIAVQFDKTKILKLFQDRQIGVYLGTPPDVLLWILWKDMDGSQHILADGDSNGFITSLKARASFYGQSVFLPIMDSDDISSVNANTFSEHNYEDIAGASGRYGTKYLVIGSMENGSLHWEMYEISNMANPLYQSSISGQPFDMGKMMSHDMVYYFAKGKTEKVHGIRGASAPASNRVGLIGASVGKNKVYVVIAGRMSYTEMLNVERSLKKVSGINKINLYQSQADQNVYEIIYNGNYKELSSSITRIPGIKQMDPDAPYNFVFDSVFIAEAEEAARAKAEAQALTASSNAGVTDVSEKKETGGQTAENQDKDKKTETAEKQPSGEEQNAQQPPAKPQPQKMQAIPITDPDSIIDTSNEKL